MLSDPLPTWNDSPARQAILDFVSKVCDDTGPDYVPPARRIAAFDHDGTLWCEKPVYVQMAFILDTMKGRVESIAALHDRPHIRAMIEGDLAAMHNASIAEFLDLITMVYHGPAPEDYEAEVRAWLARSEHERFHVPYTKLAYQPMLELLAYLRSAGFKITICSGGGIEFVRTIADMLYGVPRECVIGTALNYQVRDSAGKLGLARESLLYGPINEGTGKAINLQIHLGRQPVLAIGNSTGDIDMLRMAQASSPAHLCLMVDHDDDVREYAYAGKAATFRTLESALDAAHRLGWTVISMKNDWKTIFG